MTPIPDLLETVLAGRYRIERELGQGGKATVHVILNWFDRER